MINFKVSQLMDYIRNITSKDYILSNISVEGEISNLVIHTSGRIYFSIKDDVAKLDCQMDKRDYKYSSQSFVDGDLVVATGQVNIIERNGTISLQVKQMEKFGLGKIKERFEKLRLELDSQGYFNKEYKKPIPKYPKKVGVITSPTGAAIRDILKIRKTKNTYIDVIIYPSTVQGSSAVQSLIRGLEYFEDSDVDVIIIGRGGGAYEDLDAFNSKDLALKVFEHPKAVISAVGHATDTVITDYIADASSATPTQAADMVFFSMDDYMNNIKNICSSIYLKVDSRVEYEQRNLYLDKGKLSLYSPTNKIENLLKDIKYNIEKIDTNIKNIISKNENRLIFLKSKLGKDPILAKVDVNKAYNKSLLNDMNYLLSNIINSEEKKLLSLENRLVRHDYKETLKNGFSIVEDKDGNIIKSTKDIGINDKLKLTMYEGFLIVNVEEKGDK